MNQDRARLLLLLCLLLFAVRTCLYIGLLPLNEMPDELEHFKKIRLAQYSEELETGRLEAKRLMQEITADYLYLTNTPPQRPDPASLEVSVPAPERRMVYYRVVGQVFSWLGMDSTLRAWYAGRMLSLIVGLVVIWLAWATARVLAPDRPLLAVGSAAFLALLPQFAAMSAVVSNDKAAELVGAVFFYLLVRLAAGERGRAVWWGLIVILCLLPVVKKTTFFFYLVAALAAWPWWRAFLDRSGGRVLAWVLKIGLTAFFLAVCFFPPVANRIVPLLGMPVLRVWGVPGLDPALFHQPGMLNRLVEQVRLADLGFWQHAYLNVQSLFKSFWADYGFLILPLENIWYLGAGLIVLAALVGWARLLYRPGPGWLMGQAQGRGVSLLAAGLVLNVAVVLVRQVAFTPWALSQGRYLFPTLIPWAVLGCLGFLALWPARWERPALALALFWIVLMDLAGLWQTILPHYYFLAFS